MTRNDPSFVLASNGSVVPQEPIEQLVQRTIGQPDLLQRAENGFRRHTILGRVPPVGHQSFHFTIPCRGREGDAHHRFDVETREG